MQTRSVPSGERLLTLELVEKSSPSPPRLANLFQQIDYRKHSGTEPMKRPTLLSLVLSSVPFVGMCFSVSLWDRIEPRVLGIPFNLAWVMTWLVLTPLVMAIVYRLERNR